MKRDYEADWLEHCIFCDGRHDPQKQTCSEFAYWLLNRFQAVGAEDVTDGKPPRSSPAAILPTVKDRTADRSERAGSGGDRSAA